MKLIKLAYNCYVLENDNDMYMFSYETCIAKYNIKNRNFFLVNNYDSYNRVTILHIYVFSQHIGMNVNTKEALERRIKDGWILLTNEIRLTEENS